MLQLIRRPAFLTAFAALLGTLVLFWLVRRAPLTLIGPVTLDAPTIFLALVLVLGATLTIASDPTRQPQSAWRAQLPVLLLFPLFRIFAVGPIHTVLLVLISLGGAAGSLWLARSMLRCKAPLQRALADRGFFLAIALSSLGLASSAGIVAACTALLSYAVLSTPSTHLGGWQRWAMAGALPVTAPFVATWLAIGAAQAAGATALAAMLWLAATLRVVAVLVAEPQNQRVQNQETRTQNQFLNKGTKERENKELSDMFWPKHRTLSPDHQVTFLSSDQPSSIVHRPSSIAPIVSVAIGTLAPPIVALLIQPVVAQLQAGLTPYGNLNVSPWIGLALLDSGSRGVITAPLLAAALLMVVIGAIVALFYSPTTNHQPPTTDDELLALLLTHSSISPSPPQSSSFPVSMVPTLVETVPWLGLLIGKRGRNDHR